MIKKYYPYILVVVGVASLGFNVITYFIDKKDKEKKEQELLTNKNKENE